MTREPPNVALPTPFRGLADTPRRLRWLLLASFVVHLLLTPLAGWVGLVGLLFPEAPEPFVEEELETIPIEMFQAPDPSEPVGAPELPAEDPVGLIEELVPEPVVPVRKDLPTPPAPTAASEPTRKPEEEKERPPRPEPSASASLERGDAGAPPAAEPSATASEPTGPPDAEQSDQGAPRPIEGPLEAAGKASSVVADQAYVSITLHADRIRDHEVGKRIAALLPALPQWNDFFPDATLNPVRDFDRVVVVGPSFHNSANVIALLEYNANPKQVRRALDHLVERDGKWLSRGAVPVAQARADRADRVFILPRPGLVIVVPPKKKDEMLALRGVGIPAPKGREAMEATLKNPHKPLARYGLQIPKSVSDARVRLTPLPDGQVKVELQATDESPERAKQTAAEVSAGINALADLSAGFAGLLELAGIGYAVKLPRVRLEARGSEIWGEQVLSREQVNFLLTQFERQALLWSQAPRARPAASAERAPARPRPSPRERARPSPSSE